MKHLKTVISKVKIPKARKIIYAKPFDGMPTEENLQIIDEDLPDLKDGEFLAQAVYLSVDPYMRAYTYKYPIGATMMGSQVAKIVDSKHSNYPIGKHVVGEFGWRTLTIADTKPGALLRRAPYLIPDGEVIPLSLFLGILGMPGNTAYFGFLEVCKPQHGNTVVISGAGGAVGNHVGQIAKMKSCNVIGISGSEEKNAWLKSLGFDHVINYKTEDVPRALKKVTPNGIDCYFDNVGGELSSQVIQRMNRYGRVAISGSISSYNVKHGELPKATIVQPSMVMNEVEMKGFLVSTWKNRWMEGINQNLKWLQEGKLLHRETVTNGFENMTQALIGVLNGDNIGKAVVKV